MAIESINISTHGKEIYEDKPLSWTAGSVLRKGGRNVNENPRASPSPPTLHRIKQKCIHTSLLYQYSLICPEYNLVLDIYSMCKVCTADCVD